MRTSSALPPTVAYSFAEDLLGGIWLGSFWWALLEKWSRFWSCGSLKKALAPFFFLPTKRLVVLLRRSRSPTTQAFTLTVIRNYPFSLKISAYFCIRRSQSISSLTKFIENSINICGSDRLHFFPWLQDVFFMKMAVSKYGVINLIKFSWYYKYCAFILSCRVRNLGCFFMKIICYHMIFRDSF
jgi:hypothetical protein